MTIQLTRDQQQVVRTPSQAPIYVVDPGTNETYVLVKLESYERMKALLAEDKLDVREAYPLIDAVAAKEGWNDPALDIYNDLDPRRKS